MDTLPRLVNEHEAEDRGGGVGGCTFHSRETFEVSGRVNCGSGKDIVESTE